MEELDTSQPSQPVSKKLRSSYTNSRGNSHKLPQQQSEKARKNELKSLQYCVPIAISDSEALNEINSLSGCCKVSGATGCWIKSFTKVAITDFNTAVKVFKDCRELTRLKNKAELDSFVQEKFRESVIKENQHQDGSIVFEMDYKINNMKMCKKAFAKAYGLSVKHLERCSAALKESSERRVHLISTREYQDDHIHDYTYKETENLFKVNLGAGFAGNNNECILL